MRRFLIDTDTASDDAVALILALAQRDVSIEAITVVAGNVPLDQALQNALYSVELMGSTVPVYSGMAMPMVRDAVRTSQHVHGVDGMGDIGLPLEGRMPARGHAVTQVIELSHRYPGELEVITLGPLSNLGMAIRLDPTLPSRLAHIWVMGGYGRELWSHSRANEFNMLIDPEAADFVYRSGAPVTQVGLDVSMLYGTFGPEAAAELAAVSDLGDFCVRIQGVLDQFSKELLNLEGFTLPDPITVAVALVPSIVTNKVRLHVDIELTGTHTSGSTVVRHQPHPAEANVDVVLDVDPDALARMLREAVEGRSNPGLYERTVAQ